MKYFKEYKVSVYTAESKQMEDAGLVSEEVTYTDSYIDFDLIAAFHRHHEMPGNTVVYLKNERGTWCFKALYEEFKRDFDAYLEIERKSHLWTNRHS